jgi:hypothetical protein
MKRYLVAIAFGILLPVAARAAQPASPLPASFTGEAVVRVAGAHVEIGLDEIGTGSATRVFFVTAADSQARTRTLRATAARVYQAESELAVFLPREHRVLVFGIAPSATQPNRETKAGPVRAAGVEELIAGATAALGDSELDVERIGARGIVGYSGAMRARISIDEMERHEVAALIEGARPKEQPPEAIKVPPPQCGRSCTMSCQSGNGCSASCNEGSCASCSCDLRGMASCSCS